MDTSTQHGTARVTPVLLVTAVAAAISGFLYGYDTGIISGALLQIGDEFGISRIQEQVITAGILVGAVLGAFAGSKLSERYGRKKTILLVGVVFVLGTLACSVAPTATTLAAARVLLGTAVGAATQTVPMFVAELAPAARRGRLVLSFQLAIGVGILVATLVGASEQLSWRWSIGLAAVPAAVLFTIMLRQPESPRWLVKAGRVDDARATLQRIRGAHADHRDVEDELDHIVGLEREQRKAPAKGWDGLRQPWIRPALVVGCGISLFTQLSGIEMIIYYTPTILTDVGFERSSALQASVALAATYVVMQVVGLAVIDRIGRRRLVLVMIPGAAVALAVLGTVFATGQDTPDTAWLLVTCLIVFMLFNAGGLQLMGWLTGSEVYPLAVRSAGTSAQAMVLWGSNAVLSLTILSMIDAIGEGGAMFVYAAFNVAAWIFIWRVVPELSGRSLEDIEGALRRDSFRPGGV
ncbi:sugar porter family MFS transporter [Kineococcus sp. SYSU DK003]|uniref:sugar porter family MFS transporter n=1 Tax=Kineococcus sp. SYSU DK003 TaxID=3383124 RepID=UPI003D7C5BF5